MSNTHTPQPSTRTEHHTNTDHTPQPSTPIICAGSDIWRGDINQVYVSTDKYRMNDGRRRMEGIWEGRGRNVGGGEYRMNIGRNREGIDQRRRIEDKIRI